MILSTKQNIGKDTIGEFDILIKPSILSFIFNIIFLVKYVFAEHHTSQFHISDFGPGAIFLYRCIPYLPSFQVGVINIHQIVGSANLRFTQY